MPAYSTVIPCLTRNLYNKLSYGSRIKFGMTNEKGFTLVELLVVISIIAILSVIGITVFTGIQKSAREAQRKEDVNTIATAYETNYNSTETYSKLTEANFASGKIPTPNGTAATSYFVAGPNSTTSPTDKNFVVCASLVDDNQCFATSSSCFCKTSAQGEPVNTFSLGNPVQNGSFETPGGEYGLALNWTAPENPNQSPGYKHATGVLLQSDNSGAILPKEGSFMQKVIAPTYTGISQTVSTLKPNTTYKLTAWIYPVQQGSGCPNVPDIGVGLTVFGATLYTSCSQMDQ